MDFGGEPERLWLDFPEHRSLGREAMAATPVSAMVEWFLALSYNPAGYASRRAPMLPGRFL